MGTQTAITTFKLFPTEMPIGYSVGFTTVCNGRDFYRHTVIPLENCTDKTETEIVQMALDELKEDIKNEIAILETYPSLLGSIVNVV